MLGSISLTSLPILNRTTAVGKKTQWYVEKCNLLQLGETTFLPYFMTAWCVFFYQSVYFFTNGVNLIFHHNIMFLWFLLNSVGKKYTPCQGMIWFSLSNVISFTLAFMWLFNYTIKALLSLRKNMKKTAQGRCPRTPAGAYAPRTLQTRVLKKWPPSQPFFAARTSPKVL